MSIVNGYCTLAELKQYVMDQYTYTASTISFSASADTISDSASGLKRFLTDQRLSVSGASAAGNNGVFTVTGATAGSIIVAETLTDEPAGNAITLTNVTDIVNDADLERAIEAASRMIDNTTRRRFYSSTETHYFDVPPDSRTLWLDDDLISVTTLTNGDTVVITATNYNLYPLNLTPKYCLKLKESSGYSWSGSTAGDTEGVITIAGAWGFAATAPTAIKQACLIQAARLWKRKDTPFGVAGVIDTAVVTLKAKLDADVEVLVLPYVRMV